MPLTQLSDWALGRVWGVRYDRYQLVAARVINCSSRVASRNLNTGKSQDVSVRHD